MTSEVGHAVLHPPGRLLDNALGVERAASHRILGLWDPKEHYRGNPELKRFLRPARYLAQGPPALARHRFDWRRGRALVYE